MTVEELVEALKDLPADIEVVLQVDPEDTDFFRFAEGVEIDEVGGAACAVIWPGFEADG